MHFIKDPDSTLDYGWDWFEWLEGDTISTSVWTVPAGLTNVGESGPTVITEPEDKVTTSVFISGGVLGEIYTITNRITTSSSPARVAEMSHTIEIRNK